MSGGFVAGVIVAIAGNWMLPDASRPTVGSEVVGTAAAIKTSTLPPDEDLGVLQACDPKRAPYGIDQCPPAPAGTMVRAADLNDGAFGRTGAAVDVDARRHACA